MAKGKDEQPNQDQFLDFALVSGKPKLYKVEDIRGKERRFPIPEDLPFPMAAAFMDAYGDWARCQFEQLKAKSEAARKRAADRYESAWNLLLDAMAPIVAIRTEGFAAPELRSEFGQNVVATWAVAIATGLDPTRWLELLGMLEAEPGKAESPSEAEASSG